MPRTARRIEKMVDEERQIVEPFAERRQFDDDDVQPVIEVFPKPAGGDGVTEGVSSSRR